MPVLQTNDAPPPVEAGQAMLAAVPDEATIEDELEVMVQVIRSLDPGQPDVVIATLMATMARCTELWVQLDQVSGRDRKARALKLGQLTKVMELVEFTYKAASRLIEVRRQDVELSR